jgi:hypothetical protein
MLRIPGLKMILPERSFMPWLDRISALVVLIFGLLASLESFRMGLWKGDAPGSGFFPLLGAGGMTLLAAFLLATSRGVSSDKQEPFLPRGDGLKKFGAVALALLIYPLLVQLLGFAPGSVLFLAILFRYPGHYGWKTSLVLSLLTVGVMYVSLVMLLKAELPKGPLGI